MFPNPSIAAAACSVIIDEMTPPVPGRVLDAGGLPLPPAAYSVARLLRGGYTGALVQVKRASDNTTKNIGYDVNGDLDTASIETFCFGTTGYLSRIFDQMGTWTGSILAGSNSGADLVQTNTANARVIFTAGAVVLKNSKPSTVATGTNKGMVSTTFTTYTGNSLSVAHVGAISSTTTTNSPRHFSAIPAAAGIGDTAVTGAMAIARYAQNEKWGSNRSGSWPVTGDADYGTLEQILLSVTQSSYLLSINGTQVAGTFTGVGDFAYNRFAIGYTGFDYQSATDDYWSEAIPFHAGLTQAQISYLNADQKAYYATPTPTPTTPTSPGLDWDALGYTDVIYSEDFDTAYTQNISGSISGTHTMNPQAYTNTVSGTHWGLYGPPSLNTNGTPKKNGNEGIGYRYPSQIKVDTAKSIAKIIGTPSAGGVSGGVSSGMAKRNVGGSTQRGGGYEIEFSLPPGQGYGPAILLWPQTNNWPDDGEIDIAEIPKGVVNGVGTLHTTLHIGASNRQKPITLKGDWTKPHTISLVWEATFMDFYMDGVRYWHMTDLSFIPVVPMWLGIQYDTGGFNSSGKQGWIALPNASTPDPSVLNIHRVKILKKA